MSQYDETLKVKVFIDPSQVNDEVERALGKQTSKSLVRQPSTSTARDTSLLPQSWPIFAAIGAELLSTHKLVNQISQLSRNATSSATSSSASQFRRTEKLVQTFASGFKQSKTTHHYGGSPTTSTATESGISEAQQKLIDVGMKRNDPEHYTWDIFNVERSARSASGAPKLLRQAAAQGFGTGGPTVPPVGTAAAGAAGEGAGSSGAAGVGGLAGGLAIAGIVVEALRLAYQGFSRGASGSAQFLGAGLTGNSSNALKGYVNQTAGPIQAASGILGPLVGKLADKFNELIDSADKLVEGWGQVNATIAVSNAQLKIQELQAQQQSAQQWQGVATAYNRLKGVLLASASDEESRWANLLSGPLEGAINTVTAAFEKLSGIGQWIADHIPGLGKASSTPTNDKSQFLAGYVDANYQVPTFQPASVRSAVGGYLGNVHTDLSSNTLAASIKARDTYSQFVKQDQRDLNNPNLSAKDRATINETLARDQKKLSAEEKRIGAAKTVGTPATGSGLPISQPSSLSTQPTTQPAPVGRVDFNQNVNVTLQSKIASEAAVLEAIMQVRDQMLRDMSDSRDESRLLVASVFAGKGY